MWASAPTGLILGCTDFGRCEGLGEGFLMSKNGTNESVFCKQRYKSCAIITTIKCVTSCLTERKIARESLYEALLRGVRADGGRGLGGGCSK